MAQGGPQGKNFQYRVDRGLLARYGGVAIHAVENGFVGFPGGDEIDAVPSSLFVGPEQIGNPQQVN